MISNRTSARRNADLKILLLILLSLALVLMLVLLHHLVPNVAALLFVDLSMLVHTLT